MVGSLEKLNTLYLTCCDTSQYWSNFCEKFPDRQTFVSHQFTLLFKGV